MSKTYIHIPVSGPPTTVQVREGDNELDVLQKLVDGYIEVVANPEHGFEMVINEEGKLDGLHPNFTAYNLVWRQIGMYDMIVGDAVIVGSADEMGDFTSVPKELIDRLV